MSQLKLRFLGGFQATLEGVRLALQTDKIRSLLAYLALKPDRPHRRGILAAFFWGDWPEVDALRNLRQSLHRLRIVLDQTSPGFSERLFTITRQDVIFHSSLTWSDVMHLEQGIAGAATHAHASLAECPGCLASLAEAVSHYQGELLAGQNIGDAPEFESWLLLQRERYQQLVLNALSDLADACYARGEAEQAYNYAAQQLNLDPWREAACRQAIAALAAAGRRSEALNQYHAYRAMLQDELGVEPETETEALYATIRDGVFVPPAPAFATPAPASLPIPLTSFVGRAAELQQIRSLLSTARLLTLTGAGGSGKTRLALEAGQRLASSYADGVWWVELADLSQGAPSLDGPPTASSEQFSGSIAAAIAAALQIPETPDQPLPRVLIEALRRRHLLLILDNCEHLLPACAQLVEHLLARCPEIQVLATSRENLNIPGEQLLPVPTLPVPDPQTEAEPEALLTWESVRLFVDRVTAHQPSFRLNTDDAAAVLEICRRLDGIPLALELAAARTRSLSIKEMVPLLARRFDFLTGGSRTALPRQQTLRALIDWSYDLLTEPERTLFRRLAVFRGGWSLAAAEAVCADTPASPRRATIGGESVVHLLSRLVEKSLVQMPTNRDGRWSAASSRPDETRYHLLDTIHAYVEDQLMATSECSRLRDRHAMFYAELAEAANAAMFSGQEVAWLTRLESEHDNLRAALKWTLAGSASVARTPERVITGIRLAGGLAYFWDIHNHLAEAELWLHRAWDLADDSTPRGSLADLCSGLGTLHWKHARHQEAEHWHQAALGYYRQAGHERGEGLSWHHLAVIAMDLNDWARAETLFQVCIQIGTANNHPEITALGWVGLGSCYLEMARPDQALAPLEKGVAMLRRQDMQRALGYASTTLADIYLQRNNLERTRNCIDQIETSFRLTQDRNLEIAGHTYRARLLQRQGYSDEASAAWQAALLASREIGANTYLRGCIEGYGQLLAEKGDLVAALTLLSACEAHQRSCGLSRSPSSQAQFDAALDRIADCLPPVTLSEIRSLGEGMTLEEALDYAIAAHHESGGPQSATF